MTSISLKLHLVDFADTAPSTLQQQVISAIDTANAFLDELTVCTDSKDTSTSIDAEQALSDIKNFDHINLALDRSWGILSHLNSVMSNDEIRHVHHELLPKLSAYGTRVGQHQPLFSRYQAIVNDKAFFAALEPARARAIELALRSFELSGVALPKAEQDKFAVTQSKLPTLSATFSDHVLDATQAYALPLKTEQLAGLTESGLALLADAGEQYKTSQLANGSLTQTEVDTLPMPYYVASLNIPVYLAIMTHADDRNLRETLYRAYVTRASEFDDHTNAKGQSLNNANIMSEILQLREQKARLLGFDNYAEVSLSTKMADSVAEVETFLRDLAVQATPTAAQDLAQLQKYAQDYGIEDLQPWDSAYIAEKVKQSEFSLSQEEIRPYFPLPKVISGLFAIVERLYGIKVQEQNESVLRWHDEVRFYQLFDADDNLLGGFYFDLFARSGKRGGAWMSGFQSRYSYEEQNHQQLPVCFMVGNFTPALDGKPSLLTHDEVVTLFHEFGHGLHHLLTQVTVGDVAGVNGVEWDAVELPSQFMENWAWDAEGIALISSHVETGTPLPKEKLDALLAVKNFQSGLQTLRQIEFALFDLLIHAHTPALDYEGILTTLNSVRNDIAILQTPDYNRFANGFSHIFAGGYAAGYYSYKWAELLSADAFSKFEEDGIFNPITGKAFRETILSVGGSFPAKVNFENFRGRSASIDALLRHSGFSDTKDQTKSSTAANASITREVI
ncbi:M3 family metallopeptidase [Psychrobacter cryohalolentis]|uniref:oligopeptidase A n=1 Tax=Psychrobacter cryohalolentis (strain ATCC BAA-1226 / DSM 17306 / VKM B-2378 / K5) TaxID=335284 RepID=Q1QEN5_PSYCK|nr:M3 family metallopeptidase [Psychrobacter cryohalolentis]ABE73868.1 oligopeptidase A, Metallo peptidase, MEROPS family M03A [Psychrobacter cryohalolentis K5]ASE26506.1 M3 family peptidase [Psychrobacter cryohalolentis]